MNRPFSQPGQIWQSNRLSEDARKRVIEAGKDRADDIADTKRAFKRAGWWVGASGLAVGVLGMACAAAMFVERTMNPKEVVVIERDAEGAVRTTMRAVDAADKFTEVTARQHLRLFLDYCEAYKWETARMTATRCQLFLAPDARARWVEMFNGSDSPQRTHGQKGSISVADRVTYTHRGTGRNGTQMWSLAWNRVEAKEGDVARCTPWATEVTFRWRPELPMASDDRTHNAGGMQISSIRSQPDTVRTECR